MKKHIYTILIILFSAIFLVSAGFLAKYFIESAKQRNQYDELSQLVQQHRPSVSPSNSTDPTGSDNNTEPSDSTKPTGDGKTESNPVEQPSHVMVTHPETGESIRILTEYAPIFERNSDLVGWIKIDGTEIDYPVLQTPKDPNYYLYRDFYKKNSSHGAIYANERATIADPSSDNITLYGHKMRDGSMFSALYDYMDRRFCEEHTLITFDTLTEHHTYQVVAVFRTTADDKGFAYHHFINGNEDSFTQFIAQCKSLSVHNTGISAFYGDKLLTLSTCDLSVDNGRLVVVAKRIS